MKLSKNLFYENHVNCTSIIGTFRIGRCESDNLLVLTAIENGIGWDSR